MLELLTSHLAPVAALGLQVAALHIHPVTSA